MADNQNDYISTITLPDGTIYVIKDQDAVRQSDFQTAINNVVLPHKLTFGAGGIYQYDGSSDVTVPVYTGGTL